MKYILYSSLFHQAVAKAFYTYQAVSRFVCIYVLFFLIKGIFSGFC